MKRFGSILLAVLLFTGLCGCGQDAQPSTSSVPTTSAPTTITAGNVQSTTTGALVVTDPQGSAVTEADGSLVTTIVNTLPTTIRPVTKPDGSTVTKPDGTKETEVVVPPHITVSTDAQGTTHTSHVPEQTITTTTTTVATTNGADNATTTQVGTTADKNGSSTTTASHVTTGAATTVTTDVTTTTAATSVTATTVTTTTTAATTTTVTTTTTTTTTAKPTTTTTARPITLPSQGHKGDENIVIGAVSISGNTVTIEVKNTSKTLESEYGKSYFEYVCYDALGNEVKRDKINFGYIKANSSKICTFEVTDNTTKVELTGFAADYWSIPV